jgi:hypothetical protein
MLVASADLTTVSGETEQGAIAVNAANTTMWGGPLSHSKMVIYLTCGSVN